MNRAHKKSAKDSFHFCKDESDDVVKKGGESCLCSLSLFPPSHMFTQLIEETRKKRLELLISYYMEYVSITKCVMFPFSITGTGPAENSHQKVPLVT